MAETLSRVHEPGSGERRELTPESIVDIWSRTYNTEGKPDWSNLYPYYHPDIVFQDSIQKLQYDLYYVKNHTLFFDLYILVETVEVVLFRKGSR